MQIQLIRKLADYLDGIDVSAYRQGDVIELPRRDAELLIAEGWAVAFYEPANREIRRGFSAPERGIAAGRLPPRKIGRGAGRGRGEISGGGRFIKKKKRESSRGGLLKLKPAGGIPVLEIGDGRTVAESNAVFAYLAEVTPMLVADRDPRADDIQGLF